MIKPKTIKPIQNTEQVVALTERPAQSVIRTHPAETTPNQMLSIVVGRSGSMDEIQKFMDLMERHEKNEARKKYFAGLSLFQKLVPIIKKETKVSYAHKNGGGRTDYSYATLGLITQSIKDAESEAGLSHSWEMEEVENGSIKVTVIIHHADGHEQRGMPMTSPPDKSGGKEGIQAKGSAITYLQRYTLIAALGLGTADSDDDARSHTDNSIDQTPVFQDVTVLDGKIVLQKPTGEQINNALEAVMSGTVTVEEIKKQYLLDIKQVKALETAQKSFDSMPETAL